MLHFASYLPTDIKVVIGNKNKHETGCKKLSLKLWNIVSFTEKRSK